jgi:hypothetical protein
MILLRNFDRSGHIDAFRSIMGERRALQRSLLVAAVFLVDPVVEILEHIREHDPPHRISLLESACFSGNSCRAVHYTQCPPDSIGAYR